jgi:hypothetical protein
MATYKYLGDAGPDGTILGRDADDLIGFYGTTPCDQPAAVTAVATTAATSSSPYGYSTSTQADAIVTAVNALITNLAELGLIASS